MLVDLARNDVNRVCQPKTVKVDHLMRLERFSHVIHLTSQVSGILREDKSRFVSPSKDHCPTLAADIARSQQGLMPLDLYSLQEQYQEHPKSKLSSLSTILSRTVEVSTPVLSDGLISQTMRWIRA